jgi:hypothetical protein
MPGFRITLIIKKFHLSFSNDWSMSILLWEPLEDTKISMKGLNTQDIINGVCLDSRIGSYGANSTYDASKEGEVVVTGDLSGRLQIIWASVPV